METQETTNGELIPAQQEGGALMLTRTPDEILSEAQKAATALSRVIAGKKKKVMFNGEQYLEFEDWLTVAKFYGLTVGIKQTKFVEYGEVTGFEATATVINQSGVEVSAADAMCLNDEPNWAKKPLYQIRSMAQTRACAKALRQVLAWVVVLAGYRPTPAEEMIQQTVIPVKQKKMILTGDIEPNSGDPMMAYDDSSSLEDVEPSKNGEVISEAQAKRLFAISKSAGMSNDQIKDMAARYGYEHSRDILKADYDKLCQEAQKGGK